MHRDPGRQRVRVLGVTRPWAGKSSSYPGRQRVRVFRAGHQDVSSFGCTATLDARGFEFSAQRARRVQIFSNPKPWSAVRVFDFPDDAEPPVTAQKGSSFWRTAGVGSQKGSSFWRGSAEGFQLSYKGACGGRRVHILCPARKLEPFVPWAD